ncbi:MAG: 1-aminocyclopropane-1-carboxylate deaminase [Gammaproteobacteria bacterium]|jgi:1-aminocyclopropane-1-carboxylate deaminase
MGVDYFTSGEPIPMQEIVDKRLSNAGVELFVCRLDLYDSTMSGNKFFKLKYNIEEAKKREYKQLLSFGGAYSNHIHAMAIAGNRSGIATVGVIRGAEDRPLSETLTDAVNEGMTLHFVSREDYRLRSNISYQDRWLAEYPDSYIIPEGGGNVLGMKGCMEIIPLIQKSMKKDFDVVALPCGTGSTLAGIIASMPELKEVLGIAVLKGAQYLDVNVKGYLQHIDELTRDEGQKNICSNWSINHNHHCGGYAKVTPELAHFIIDFQRQHDVPLEPVYSGKLFLALFKLIASGEISGKRIVAIHTGGLQGLRGMKKQIARKLASI